MQHPTQLLKTPRACGLTPTVLPWAPGPQREQVETAGFLVHVASSPPLTHLPAQGILGLTMVQAKGEHGGYCSPRRLLQSHTQCPSPLQRPTLACHL